jgi:modification methylase
MFSFTGDTILDPFCGSGTKMVAALQNGRSSLGVEIDREYCRMVVRRLKAENAGLFASCELIFEKAQGESSTQTLCVDPELSRLRVTHQRTA